MTAPSSAGVPPNKKLIKIINRDDRVMEFIALQLCWHICRDGEILCV